MLGKNFKIWGVRGGMIGDSIMALPVLNYLEILYPGSYKYWVIHKRFAQSGALYFNHPLIDKIKITEEPESLSKGDSIEENSCDLTIELAPQHPDGDHSWYNKYSCCEETFRMTGFDVEHYRAMAVSMRKPKLVQWFDSQRLKGTIGIWPFAHYGRSPERSPSVQWWEGILSELSKDFNILHFGHFNEPHLKCYNYKNLTEMSLVDQVKIAYGCDLNINTDSGSGWIIGAYGLPQISLISIAGRPWHRQNLLALNPENYNDNNIPFVGLNSCDEIGHEEVISAAKRLL